MARRSCIGLLACGLAACAPMGSRVALRRPSSPVPPVFAEGLWVMLDPGCQKPGQIDTQVWPKCASPFWISQQSALVVQTRPGPHGDAPATSYRAELSLTEGDPLIVKAGTLRDGSVFLALARVERDEKGRMVGAVGAAFACRAGGPGPISLKPSAGGCELASPDDLRIAARQSLLDEAGLTRVTWVAPGAP